MESLAYRAILLIIRRSKRRARELILQYFHKALNIAENFLKPAILEDLGKVYYLKEDFRKSKPFYEHSMRLVKTLNQLLMLASIYYAIDTEDKAEEILLEAVAIGEAEEKEERNFPQLNILKVYIAYARFLYEIRNNIPVSYKMFMHALEYKKSFNHNNSQFTMYENYILEMLQKVKTRIA